MNTNIISNENLSRMKKPEKDLSIVFFRWVVLSCLISVLFLAGQVPADVISTAISPGMNLSINPGEDFFSYANYHWILDHPVPEG
ncbi:MAG: hypothetical protein PHD71_09350, partial [Methanospirillum sp.]|nr:hypothetical protein [Methanospirillum sp.]